MSAGDLSIIGPRKLRKQNMKSLSLLAGRTVPIHGFYCCTGKHSSRLPRDFPMEMSCLIWAALAHFLHYQFFSFNTPFTLSIYSIFICKRRVRNFIVMEISDICTSSFRIFLINGRYK